VELHIHRQVAALVSDTRSKMVGARLIFHALRALGLSPEQRVTRGGVHFDLDLREGIDLSVYLTGHFQQHVMALRALALSSQAVVFDVGANIGALTLAWARALPAARIYAFEPTHFAFAKLQRNIALNPQLAPRVEPVQTFLSSAASRAVVPEPYASWRIDELAGERHPVHLGEVKSATEQVTTIDEFIAQRGLARLDLIKIDTDGHELEVLRGASQSLSAHRPSLVFEVGPYLLEERGVRFEEYEELLRPLGYDLTDARRGIAVSAGNLRSLAPRRGTLDVLAKQRA
jgi:FkbM family methyltransferase